MADRFQVALRRSRRNIREHLSLEYQNNSATQICDRIIDLEIYREAKHIALYQAFGGEVNLYPLWMSALAQGKCCYFPILGEDQRLLFLPATESTPFSENRYGIKEPEIDTSEALSPEFIHIIFIPLVAFDDYGTRLGMGAGYYDRTLAKVNHSMLIGVAYDFQYYPYIERKPWDIPLHGVITPSKTLWSIK